LTLSLDNKPLLKGMAMSEPREDDDIALDKDSECEDCGNFMFECVCSTPDEPFDVAYAD
jgi:hypothetical protein